MNLTINAATMSPSPEYVPAEAFSLRKIIAQTTVNTIHRLYMSVSHASNVHSFSALWQQIGA